MKGILIGAAVGYVLGARAGRRRYDQIVRAYRSLTDHPAVQGAAGIVRAKVSEKTGFGRHQGHQGTTAASNANGHRRDPVIPRTN
ncbi:hypothetical protein [Saccharothrix yanglingensis]|uniref:YtxH domain-containing protein n=1 Tax=Saccharothrix yanglingensis TaxID=659496 RepID=A0ABU0X5K2_9PSEU|nr:hypothetical protein [Saccharothrix yanglingensis]MDQ2585874.1 hypothetical protein [Saccharothrix yanglingensis]